MLQMEIALKTLDYLKMETEYVPWVAAGSQLGYIHDMVAETELYGAFEVSIVVLQIKSACVDKIVTTT